MSEKFDTLSDELQAWIAEQPVFFVATAARSGSVNVSPKGHDSLRVLNERELLWLNLTGSGNESAAHLLDCNRMTLMWCAFAGPPRILRVYGTAQVIHPRDPAWQACAELLPAPLGARQYFKVAIDLVQTSCGYAVPLMDYTEDRKALTLWADKRGPDGIETYWRDRNQVSIDGLPTDILPG
ncbi:MAG: pyridoxamine 5'-phosphate oxidase family protein [Pseudomonadota bacterium]